MSGAIKEHDFTLKHHGGHRDTNRDETGVNLIAYRLDEMIVHEINDIEVKGVRTKTTFEINFPQHHPPNKLKSCLCVLIHNLLPCAQHQVAGS